MFIDEAKISIKAGDGGKGCVSFRREKNLPRGGPNGGDGGRGGDVIFIADRGESTLLKFRYTRHFDAQNGGNGEGSDKRGKNGETVIIKVPLGTLIKQRPDGETLCDLTEDGAEFTSATGGIGGKGNAFFKSSVRQAPKFAQPGMPGDGKDLLLELKLLADVGLVDEHAANDIRGLRDLLGALRIAKRTAWQTVVRLITTGLILALIAGVAIKLKLFGGIQ